MQSTMYQVVSVTVTGVCISLYRRTYTHIYRHIYTYMCIYNNALQFWVGAKNLNLIWRRHFMHLGLDNTRLIQNYRVHSKNLKYVILSDLTLVLSCSSICMLNMNWTVHWPLGLDSFSTNLMHLLYKKGGRDSTRNSQNSENHDKFRGRSKSRSRMKYYRCDKLDTWKEHNEEKKEGKYTTSVAFDGKRIERKDTFQVWAWKIRCAQQRWQCHFVFYLVVEIIQYVCYLCLHDAKPQNLYIFCNKLL